MPCLKIKRHCISPPKHHINSEVWRWEHHGVGPFFQHTALAHFIYLKEGWMEKYTDIPDKNQLPSGPANHTTWIQFKNPWKELMLIVLLYIKLCFFNKHFACQLSSELQTVKYIRRSEPKCVRIMKGWALKDKLHIWLQWFFDYRSCSQHHPVTDKSSNKPTLYAKFTYLTLEQNYSNSKMTWLKKNKG